MPKEQIKLFFKQLNENESLRDALEESIRKNDDEELNTNQIINRIVSFATDRGFDFDQREYKQAIGHPQQKQEELSEKELEAVAGGGPYNDVMHSIAQTGKWEVCDLFK